jgi:RNA polymerase sigma-70 factor (ECF subfamily)
MDLLVSRHYRRLFNFSYRMLHQREAAEDVAQETFLRAYRNAHRYRAESRFSTWLFAIAANLCRTELRRRSRHPECGYTELGEFESPMSVEKVALRHLEGVEVRRALEKLSADQRMALVLFYFEGMSYQDISQVCGCSLGTVKSRLHYALAKMRGFLPTPAYAEELVGRGA